MLTGACPDDPAVLTAVHHGPEAELEVQFELDCVDTLPGLGNPIRCRRGDGTAHCSSIPYRDSRWSTM